MTPASPFVDLVIALGLGLLVGLQRETKPVTAAGLRTFALVSVGGATAALIGEWVIASGLLAVAIIAAVSHYASSQRGDGGGLTTEVALVAMFLVGALPVLGHDRLAVVLGGGIAVLLQAKERARSIMERLGTPDVRAIMQFALLSLVILPVLPNRDFGPWRVFNVFEIWLLVVLIVGINLAGYILYKFIRGDTGALISGLLGGVISSTATTVSYSRRARQDESAAPLGAVIVMIATAVVLVRVLIEVAVVAPGLLGSVAVPISIVLAVSVVLSLLVWWRVRGRVEEMPEQKNPTMLRAALVFAAMYAVVLLAVEWVREQAGTAGMYVVAAVAGLTDVDAITLSTAKLSGAGHIDASQAWRVILIAFISNLVFKAGIVAVAGSRQMLTRVLVLFGILAAASGAVIVLYP
ncbi:MAG TPA: MgtC/SapB family protein [Thermoanaerobaculia bacterium]|nr:MgtC/SapB family protein [Thermoanaerobaculia bacterium]